jgi:membrane protease YdiL (CAAX protease family)
VSGTPPVPGSATALPPAGWYADPYRVARLRWWDGNAWTGWAEGELPRPWFPARGSDDRTGAIKGGGIAIGGFVAAILASIAVGFAAWGLGVPRDPIDGVLVASQLALWAVMFATCVLAVRRHGTGSLRDLGLQRVAWRDVGIGVVAGLAGRFASAIVIIPFVPLLRDEKVDPNAFSDGLQSANVITVIAIAVIVVVGAAFFEELFFRGLVQGVLTRRWGPWIAVWAQAMLFALVHLGPDMSAVRMLATLAAIGTIGLLLGVLRYHYDRLAPGMFAHATFNVIAVGIAIALA